MTPKIVAVHQSPKHDFSKQPQPSIRLLAGLGVEGDTHSGTTVQHRSRVAVDPTQPNLRQVHLLHAELFDELRQRGFEVSAGQIGENITTAGIDLLGLPTGTHLRLGESSIVEITGLRNPCTQIDNFQPGLMQALIDRQPDGQLIRKAGVMVVVLTTGELHPGDTIEIELPPLPHRPLERI